MARHIRIPGVIDLVLADAPADIRAFADQAGLDRRFDRGLLARRGPLLNRLIVGRLRRWFRIGPAMLPSFLPRDDAERAARQTALADRLAAPGQALWSEAQIERLAAHVRGESPRGGADDMAVTVQEIVGRLFSGDYAADRSSWDAAQRIDRLSAGVSLQQIADLITGRTRKARALLAERAGEDRWAMHGTAIGVHGIADAVERMRALRTSAEATALSDDAVLARCLRPPRQVARTVETPLSTVEAGELRPGALVLLRLERAWPQAPDHATIFMQGRWNACPAAGFVGALLIAVWHRSARGGAPGRAGGGRP